MNVRNQKICAYIACGGVAAMENSSVWTGSMERENDCGNLLYLQCSLKTLITFSQVTVTDYKEVI